MFTHLQQFHMTADVEKQFSRVLSHSEWSKIRRAETQRESARLELREAKAKRRKEFLVVNESQPISGQPPLSQAAAAAFARISQSRLESLGGQPSENQTLESQSSKWIVPEVDEAPTTDATIDRPMQEDELM